MFVQPNNLKAIPLSFICSNFIQSEDVFNNIDNLPELLLQNKFKCISDHKDGDTFLKQAIENELNFQTIGELYPHWKEWKYQVKVKLSLYEEEAFHTHHDYEDQNDHQETFSLELLTGHVVMMLNNPEILSALLQIEPNNHQYWMAASENVPQAVGRIMDGDDDWICQASCFHLASRFYQEGLNIILTFFDQRGMKNELIKMTHQDGKFSPLHCASFQPESLGTRYQTTRNLR